MAGASEFDWERLPSEAVRAFARVLDGVGAISDEVALATLRGKAAVPDATFLAPRPMRDVAFQRWLPRDAVAFDRVYEAASTDTKSQRSETKPRRLARLQNQRPTPKLMTAVLEALLAAGRATAPLADDKQLTAFMPVPTIGGEPYHLFPYQVDVVDQIRSHAKMKQRPHGLVVMPTGSGKTKTVVWWLVNEQIGAGRKVLWITHRAELLEQAARTFIEAAPLLNGRLKILRIRLFGGGYGVPRANAIAERDHEVVIATVPTLNGNLPALTAFLQREDVVIIVDEAHHSTAKTWRQIIELARTTNDAVLGLTATPTRMAEVDAKALSALYDNTVIARVDMRELITARYLAEPRISRVETRIDMEQNLTAADLKYLRQFNELAPRMVARLAKHVGRNKTIVQTWLADRDKYGPTIAFAVNIAHAMTLAEAFQKAGVAADWVSHTKDGRKATLARFRAGELQVLVNVELLTEGVDLPAVQTVLLCRPTQSEVLMSQMIGRALRGPGVESTVVVCEAVTT
jgi:superfamily II DNA or RNA helicase